MADNCRGRFESGSLAPEPFFNYLVKLLGALVFIMALWTVVSDTIRS